MSDEHGEPKISQAPKINIIGPSSPNKENDGQEEEDGEEYQEEDQEEYEEESQQECQENKMNLPQQNQNDQKSSGNLQNGPLIEQKPEGLSE